MSKAFRDLARQLRQDNRQFTRVLQPIAVGIGEPDAPVRAWRSDRFLVQQFAAENGAERLTICRAAIDETTGRWIDGITWDEIQGIKSEIGFGDKWAVEVYPPDAAVVNVANMRHIWLVDQPAFAWKKEQQ